MSRRLISGAALGLLLLPSLAAHPGAPEIRFDRLGMSEGLSQNTVYAIATDRVGFMWFGTEDGLNRYDGREFRVFRNDPDDSSSLSSNAVLALHVDAGGTLWIGTADGIDRFDPLTERFTRIGHGIDSLRGGPVYGFAETGDGRVWAVTLGNGLIQVDPESNKATAVAPDGLDASIFSVTSCDGRALWLGTRSGLVRLDAHHPEALDAPQKSAAFDRTYSVHCAPDGRLWFAT
ncbi:MAG TPA: two-component regulator propeller domain-containing protein, partial [Rhodothermales bacterium]